jgi:hypothetical protein
MTQRRGYRYALLSDGSDRGRQLLKFVRVQIPGSDLPRSPRHGNRIHTQESENSLRHVESGNGNSIFSPKELSL